MVYGQKPKGIPSLKEAIVTACIHFDQEFCQKVYCSVLERAERVMADRGHFEHIG
jgi:hypothetical protein